MKSTECLDRVGTRHDTSVGGRRLVWRRFGSGPDLVMLHGGHGSWLHWIRNIESLSARYTLWIPDLPGFGESDSLEDAEDDDERMQRLVDAVIDSMGALGAFVRPVDLAAFSFGALVGARIAARGLVRRLALVAPAGHGGRKPPREPLVKWKGLEKSEREAALRHNLVTLMLHHTNLDAQAISIYEAQCHAARFRVKQIVRNGGLRHALERSAVPLLLVWGEHDVTAIPNELGPQLVAGLNAPAEWRVIEGAGHWVQYERAAPVSELLIGWFNEAAARETARASRPGSLPISKTSMAGWPGSEFIP